ncbi:MAG: hypothetical protein Q9157_005292 [Trypethelium eluteriae]
MQAIRLRPASPGQPPYSPQNPAPSSALQLGNDVQIPMPTHAGELLVRIRAATVTRDELTWPEIYVTQSAIPGLDFAGTVVSTSSSNEESPFKAGDEIFGMVDTDRSSVWAEYAIVKVEEACAKPRMLSWEEAAALPLSALTAYQALFDKAGLPRPTFGDLRNRSHNVQETTGRRILITGATGCVGIYLVQLAKLAGNHVAALTSSDDRNRDFLLSLGADEVVETGNLGKDIRTYDAIIDTIGGKILEMCWSRVTLGGNLVSVESSSFGFDQKHRQTSADPREDVRAVFFIVKPSRARLEEISQAIDLGLLRAFVAESFPLMDAQLAYDQCKRRSSGRGKIVLTI